MRLFREAPVRRWIIPESDQVLDSGDTVGEAAEIFGAQMYLMWDPTLPGPGQTGCAAATSVEKTENGSALN